MDIDTEKAKYGFTEYILSQKQFIFAALGITAISYSILKYCFPNPDFFGDSFSYINCAILKCDTSYRPTGYSDFLRLIHNISDFANFTVFIQYLLFFLSTLFWFLSVDYLFHIPKKIKWLLLILSILNPIILFQTNLISSDSIFCSLTVCWFTLCLWAIKKHKWWALVLQIFFLYLSFKIRYTALFFPLISAAAFIFSTAKLKYKLIGIALTVSVILFAINQQKNINKSKGNLNIFSGFSGWQIANNVLCYYKGINIDEYDLPTEECQLIDRFVKQYIDSIYKFDYVGTQYMWSQSSPLKKYLHVRVNFTHNTYFTEWMTVSIPLSEYGWSIIKNNPMAYVRYFMLPNTKNYFYPPKEFLENYNSTNVMLTEETRKWYNFKSGNLYCKYPDLQKRLITVYPAISLCLNVFNIVAIFIFLFKYLPVRKKIPKDTWGLFLTWSVFYFSYMTFSIFSTIVSLRYLDPLYVIGIIIPFVLLKPNQIIGKKIPF